MIHKQQSMNKDKAEIPILKTKSSLQHLYIYLNYHTSHQKVISHFRKVLNTIVIIALFMSLMENFSRQNAKALEISPLENSLKSSNAVISGHVISNGQFVYGPNLGTFNLETYIDHFAPYLNE